MNKNSLIKLSGYLNIEVSKSQTRANWLVCHCPFAEWLHEKKIDVSPSFAIFITEKQSYYNCFSCNSKGGLYELVYSLKSHKAVADYKNAMAMVENEEYEMELDIPDFIDDSVKTIEVWPESYLSYYKSAIRYKRARDYLESRRLPLSIIDELDLVYDPSQHRIAFPIRNWKGKLVGLHGRDVTNESPLRYLVYRHNRKSNKVVWYGEELVDVDMPVVLVESVFDRAAVHRVYRNTIASLSCGMSADKLRRITSLSEVITMYDYGKGGDQARRLIELALKDASVTHLIPSKEQDDPGNMSADEIAMMLQKHVVLDSYLV